MGTSFTEFAGYGFWARDEQVEIWLALMVNRFDSRSSRTLAQQAIRIDHRQ